MATTLEKLKSDYPAEWIERLDLTVATPSIDFTDVDNFSAQPSSPKRSRSANLEASLADDDQGRELRLYFLFNTAFKLHVFIL